MLKKYDSLKPYFKMKPPKNNALIKVPGVFIFNELPENKDDFLILLESKNKNILLDKKSATKENFEFLLRCLKLTEAEFELFDIVNNTEKTNRNKKTRNRSVVVLKYLNIVKKNLEDIISENKETLEFLGKSNYLENKNYLLRYFVSSFVRFFNPSKKFTMDRNERLEVEKKELNNFFHKLKMLKEYKSFINATPYLYDIEEQNLLTDFYKHFFFYFCDKKDCFKTQKTKTFNLMNKNIDITFDININSDCFDVLPTIEFIEDLKPFDLNLINKVNLTDQKIESYIKDIFNSLTEDLNILNKDNMLKDVLFDDFKEKILSDLNKKFSQKLTFNFENVNKDDKWEKITDNAIKRLLFIREERLQGFSRSIKRKVIRNNIEIGSFKDLFPEARKRDRELYYFYGETNSGKTYNAFELAKDANSGLYAAPLRLLALEGQQEFEKRGKLCSMITGEEKDEKANATFVSSTVEMTDFQKEYDIAIIDEVQLLNDRERGHSWFEAIVGVNAKKVILVGSKDISNVVKEIAEYLEEPLISKEFTRKTKLVFDKDLYKKEIKNNKKLSKNSAVIAFSKRDVLDLKEKFEDMGNTVSVIYGALPPKVRRYETERFVKGESDIVIATDAVGMGLNLPIEKLYFYSNTKFNGKSIVELESSLIKQIAGRAGRFNLFDVGYVSALSDKVFDSIQEGFTKSSFITEKKVKSSPNYPIIKQVEEITGETEIFKLIQTYNNAIVFDFNISHHLSDTTYKVAKYIDKISDQNGDFLDLKEKVKLVNAPISEDRAGKVMKYFESALKTLQVLRKDPTIFPYDLVIDYVYRIKHSNQKETENAIKMIDILSWLSFNFEEFSSLENEIIELRNILNNKLINFLHKK